jgi:hypothetical protein
MFARSSSTAILTLVLTCALVACGNNQDDSAIGTEQARGAVPSS